jgi:hypothetical protein
MIRVEIKTISDYAMWACHNEQCKKLPQYILYLRRQSLWEGDRWFIKQGTTAAFIGHYVYCRDCIDEVYHLMKSKLDSKLWVFE